LPAICRLQQSVKAYCQLAVQKGAIDVERCTLLRPATRAKRQMCGVVSENGGLDRGIDDSSRSSNPENHGIGSTCNLDAFDIEAVGRQRGREVVPSRHC